MQLGCIRLGLGAAGIGRTSWHWRPYIPTLTAVRSDLMQLGCITLGLGATGIGTALDSPTAGDAFELHHTDRMSPGGLRPVGSWAAGLRPPPAPPPPPSPN